MNEKVEKVKQHIRENKTAYLAGIGGVLIGAAIVGRGAQVVDGFKLIHLQYKSPNLYQVAMARRGHPGFIIRCLETGEVFASQNRAAAANCISPSNLSQHLNGLQDAVSGLHFERMGEAVA